MKAILTSDGSIKIILSDDDRTESDERIKENFLSKEKPASKAATKAPPIDLMKVFQDEGDDDDRYAQYKQTPRQVFLPTVCHVS